MNATTTTPYEAAAPSYVEAGWSAIPVRGKHPPLARLTGYDAPDVTVETVEKWVAASVAGGAPQVGLRVPKCVVGIDVDAYDGKRGDEFLEQLIERFGELPPTWSSTARGADQPSRIALFLIDPETKLRPNPAPGIEVVQWHHRYVMAWPSTNPKVDALYRWYRPDGTVAEPGELPRVDDLPHLPTAWAKGLRVGSRVEGETRAHVDPKLVDEFLADKLDTWTDGGDYDMLAADVAELKAARYGSRHDTMLGTVGRIVNHARDGRYPLRVGLDTAFAAFEQVIGDERNAGPEFADAIAWVVAQREAEPSIDNLLHGDYGPLEDDDETTNNRYLAGLIDWPTFWETDHNDAQWLLEPVIATARGHSLSAAAKDGKSEITLAMAAALATGRPFLHHPGGEPLHVLYVDMEMGEADLAERLEELGYGPDDDLDQLHYVLGSAVPPLDTPTGGTELIEAAQAVGAELVIFDTMSRLVEGEENAAETIRDFYNHTGRPLKLAGIAWLRLDHTGKDPGRGSRGSSAKNDDVDVIGSLKRTDDGLRIKALARMGWYPERTDIGRSVEDDGTIRHRITPKGWPAGTKEVAELLDRLDVPLDASANNAQAALKAAGKGKRRELVRAAVKYRRQSATARLGRPGPTPGPTSEQVGPGVLDENGTHRQKPRSEAGPTSGPTPDPGVSAPGPVSASHLWDAETGRADHEEELEPDEQPYF